MKSKHAYRWIRDPMSTRKFDPAAANYVDLVTFRKTGVEVHTPVWIAPYDGKHYVFSEAKAGKVKRLKNNPAVKIALCDVRGKLLNEQWLLGEARVVTQPELVKQAYRSFTNKYGWIMRLTNLLSKMTGRYHRRTMIEIELTN
jgi:PPOX class probable F420-dependent enzyme